MTRCSVPSCSNTANHSFPKNLTLRKRWLKAIRRTDFVPKNGARICCNHFQDTDYVKISDYTGLRLQHRFLKKSAVPSIFPWTGSPTSSNQTLCEKHVRRHHLVGRSKGRESKAHGDIGTIHRHDRHRHRHERHSPRRKEFYHKPSTFKPAHESKNYELNKYSRGTQTSYSLRIFATEQLLSDGESVSFYTGLDNSAQFTFLLSTLHPMAHDIKFQSKKVNKLSIEDQFLILLIKLRRSKPDFEIGKMFGISKTDVTTVVITWVSFISDFWSTLDLWPTPAQVNMHMPSPFKGNTSPSPSTSILLENNDISIQKNDKEDARKVAFSQYRIKNIIKFLIGCSTEGLVTYSSEVADDSSPNGQSTSKGVISCVIPFDQKLATSTCIERILDCSKTYKILGNALNQSYAPLCSKIFSICLVICRFKEGILKK
ncbi:uncharacterized protein LOC118280709 [Spodoptera frugiperda]|uniref:Uncharacterized protein LOC118280709 n=1 Tax=Spodoptera frugiperda TaxID=7108 RepID=A0A9R0DXA4_SPOFR|nr:uncharacterized protein LOC118280709 [Spodoptera frugiperda]